MRVSISKSTILLTGKLSEESRIKAILDVMMSEIESMCYVECLGLSTGHEMAEYSLCYSADEATVQAVKYSYSDAKKLTATQGVMMNKYFNVVAMFDGEQEQLFGSFDRNDCVSEIECEKASWKDQGYKKIKIETVQTADSPDPKVYQNLVTKKELLEMQAQSLGFEVSEDELLTEALDNGHVTLADKDKGLYFINEEYKEIINISKPAVNNKPEFKTATTAENYLKEQQEAGIFAYTGSYKLAFENIVNHFISDVKKIDLFGNNYGPSLTVDFKDGSLLVIKSGDWAKHGFYCQTQDRRC